MVRAQLWDVIPLREFHAKKSTNIYKDRFSSLMSAIDNISDTKKLYWTIPYKIVSNIEQAEEHFQSLLADGHEGTILKNTESFWEDSRSKHLVKMKAEKTADLEIIGWNPGTGQYEGQVGSLVCASSDRKVVVSISGFSQDLRKSITENIDTQIGTIVEVLYNERIASKSKDRDQVDSLFLPRFNEFRIDKSIADSSNEIK
jgi:ATP-dependent DNA ligase